MASDLRLEPIPQPNAVQKGGEVKLEIGELRRLSDWLLLLCRQNPTLTDLRKIEHQMRQLIATLERQLRKD